MNQKKLNELYAQVQAIEEKWKLIAQKCERYKKDNAPCFLCRNICGAAFAKEAKWWLLTNCSEEDIEILVKTKEKENEKIKMNFAIDKIISETQQDCT